MHKRNLSNKSTGSTHAFKSYRGTRIVGRLRYPKNYEACSELTKDLNNDLGEVFRGWDPQFQARALTPSLLRRQRCKRSKH